MKIEEIRKSFTRWLTARKFRNNGWKGAAWRAGARVLTACPAVLFMCAIPNVARADGITATVIPADSCTIGVVGGVEQGCEPKDMYITGDGAGGVLDTINFNGGIALDSQGIATFTGSWGYNGASAPADDNSDYAYLDDSSMTIAFSKEMDFFSIDWSTLGDGRSGQGLDVVTFNNIANGVVTQVAQFTGADLPEGGGIAPFNSQNYVSFNATGGVKFNQVVLAEELGLPPYNGCCFEFDNLAAVAASSVSGTGAAPEPGTSVMAGLGLLAISAAMWAVRRRRTQSRLVSNSTAIDIPLHPFSLAVDGEPQQVDAPPSRAEGSRSHAA